MNESDTFDEGYKIVGYKCNLCGATGHFDEFPSYPYRDSEGFKDSDTFCKNIDCDGENEDLEPILNFKSRIKS